MSAQKVLVVGCGNMGASHAKAYHQLDGFEIVGLVSRTAESSGALSKSLGGYPTFNDFDQALAKTQPDVVSINTYPETHAEYVKKSFKAGAHVFVEKPIATTVEEAQELVEMALAMNKKLVIGYILRVHPAWKTFIQQSHLLGKPLIMRMNLNQQSEGALWNTHKQLMNSMSPIVDCGVHYVDVMCQMTRSKPTRVSAIGARVSDEIDAKMYNYGQLQVSFEDGSVGWYESGWGPMMSETAFFVKDVIGPKGCVSIVDQTTTNSEGIDAHTKTNALRVHYGELNDEGKFAKEDKIIDTTDEPDHDGLCLLEQEFLLDAITNNTDLTNHMQDAVNSLKIVLAADKAYKTGETVWLK